MVSKNEHKKINFYDAYKHIIPNHCIIQLKCYRMKIDENSPCGRVKVLNVSTEVFRERGEFTFPPLLQNFWATGRLCSTYYSCLSSW